MRPSDVSQLDGRVPERQKIVNRLARLRVWCAEALARKRVTLGFVFGTLVLLLAQPTTASVVWGTSVAIAGESLRLWAAGHLNKGREVTTTGPYRWFAHPLYIGSSIMGVGLAVASESLPVTLIIALYLAVTLTAAVKSEETFLRSAFGDRYDGYRRGRSKDVESVEAVRRFSLAQAIANHELRTLVGLAAALLLLLLKATYNGSFWRAAGR